MKSSKLDTSTELLNRMKVHFLLQAEDSVSILNPFPEALEDFQNGINLAWRSVSNLTPDIRSELLNYHPGESDNPKRRASNYEFPQSAYVAFTGEILYLIGSDEEPDLDSRTPLVEEGLVCGALEKKLACHYLKLLANELYSNSDEHTAYLEKLKEFETTLDCDVPQLLPPVE